MAVFDLAGTTIADNGAVATAFSKAFEENGFSISTERIFRLMGYKKTVAIKMILEEMGTGTDEKLIEIIHNTFEEQMAGHYEFSLDVKALPGAEEVMWQLKEKGIRITMNTGFSRLIADTIMDRMQWVDLGLVDDYIASDEVTAGRPDPSMIRRLMERGGITDPKEVIKIGDTEADINEGRNAGCVMVVAVTTGAFNKEQLEPYHPDHIVKDLYALPELIAGHA